MHDPWASGEPDVEVLAGELRRRLLRRFPNGDEEDVHEAIREALNGFAKAAAEGRLELRGPVAGYLVASANRRMLNRIVRRPVSVAPRRMEQLASHKETLQSDDAIASWLDQDASRATIQGALRRAVARKRFTVVRVVASWLDLAEGSGEAPTLREVGADVGLSHTSVRNGLEEFRSFLEQELAGRDV